MAQEKNEGAPGTYLSHSNFPKKNGQQGARDPRKY